MSESKHTPGPWTVGKNTDGNIEAVRGKGLPIEDEQWGLAHVWNDADGKHEANARLIAAAPDLLAALELAEAHIGWGDASLENVHGIARAAIAKATGR